MLVKIKKNWYICGELIKPQTANNLINFGMDFKIESSRNSILLRSKFKRQSGKCFYCNKQMFLFKDHWVYHPKQATKEHLVPRSKSRGTIIDDNIVCACQKCNSERGAKNIKGFVLRQFPHRLGPVMNAIRETITKQHQKKFKKYLF